MVWYSHLYDNFVQSSICTVMLYIIVPVLIYNSKLIDDSLKMSKTNSLEKDSDAGKD